MKTGSPTKCGYNPSAHCPAEWDVEGNCTREAITYVFQRSGGHMYLCESCLAMPEFEGYIKHPIQIKKDASKEILDKESVSVNENRSNELEKIIKNAVEKGFHLGMDYFCDSEYVKDEIQKNFAKDDLKKLTEQTVSSIKIISENFWVF